MFTALKDACLRLFDSLFEREFLAQSAVVSWKIVEEKGLPVSNFRPELELFAKFFVERGCYLQVRENGMAEVVGPVGHIVARIQVVEVQEVPTYLHITYLPGVISCRGEEELRSHERIVVTPTLVL